MRRVLAFTWLQTLVWLLALALPLQAQARVSMLGCTPAQMPPAHHQMMAGTAQAHQHGGDERHSISTHQCSACAVCCIGAALPSAAPLLAGLSGDEPLAETPEPASLGVVTATLERPPRSFLA